MMFRRRFILAIFSRETRVRDLSPDPSDEGSGDRYLNHLYTNKKWNVLQERIQEILYWSHGASRYQAGSQKFHKNIKKKCRLFGNIG